MTKCVFAFVSLTGFLFAQGGRGPVNREAPVTNVPFERILKLTRNRRTG